MVFKRGMKKNTIEYCYRVAGIICVRRFESVPYKKRNVGTVMSIQNIQNVIRRVLISFTSNTL